MIDLEALAAAAVRGGITGMGTGLFALGLVLTFRVTGTLNLALGGIGSVAAFVLWATWADGSVPLAIAVALALLTAAGLGLAGDAVSRPLAGARPVVRAVATLGMLLVLQGGISLVWGPQERFLPLLVDGAFGRGNLRIGWQQMLAAAVALAATVAVVGWLRQRPSGIAALAVGENPDAARLLGVRPRRVSAGVWVASAVLAGAAGMLLSGLTVLNTTEMTLAMLAALAGALLAGFDRPAVAVAGAAAVGSLTAMAGSVRAIAEVPGLVESVAYLVVLAVLILRPRPLTASGAPTTTGASA